MELFINCLSVVGWHSSGWNLHRRPNCWVKCCVIVVFPSVLLNSSLNSRHSENRSGEEHDGSPYGVDSALPSLGIAQSFTTSSAHSPAITTSASTALNGPNTSGDVHGPNWVPLFYFPACNLRQCVPSGHMHSRLMVADDGGSFVWDDLAAGKNKLGNPEGSWNSCVKDHRNPPE